jgi:hypothetical protein
MDIIQLKKINILRKASSPRNTKKTNEANDYAIKLKFKILNFSFNNGRGDGFGFVIRPKSEFKVWRFKKGTCRH